MKTGKPTSRLSEKLNADMEKIRSENAALIDTQLQNFRSDMKRIVSAALSIIENDTDRYRLSLRKQFMLRSKATEMEWRQIVRPLLMALLLIGMTATATWLAFTILTPSFSSLGIDMIEQPQATYLILENERTTLQRCTLAGVAVDCIRIEGE